MEVKQQQQGSAATLLLLIVALLASSARGSDCWAIETDLKYHIPLGVHGTNGGCFKGVKVDDNNCDVRTGGSTRTERIFSSLTACCEALEPQLKRDPRNGQPRTDQANAKSVCWSYKKAPVASQQQQPAAAVAGGRKLKDSSVCYSIETDYKYNIPMGVYGTFGGCVKGTIRPLEDSRKYCNTDVRLDATRAEGNYGSLVACCEALEPRLQVDPRSGQPRKDQVNGKAVCLSYKRTPPVVYGQPAPVRKYLMFKAQDLPAEFDIPSSGSPHTKVCGGLDAVAKACSKVEECGAFTYGGEKDCGYLKYRYYGDSYPGPPPLKFTGNNKGWSTYVHEGIVSKAQGGSLDCADAQNAGATLCQIKAVLPPILSSLNA